MHTKEDRIFIEHIRDLLNLAHRTGQRQVTGFLSLNQQSAVTESFRYEAENLRFTGGYELAERQCLVIDIHRDLDGVNHKDIMSTIRIVTKDKLAKLSHRDYLGALLNLGIERTVLGDILVHDELAHVFVLNHMAQYVCDQLFQIGRHKAEATIEMDMDFSSYELSFQTISATVASTRIDNIIKAAFNLSRSSALEYIKKGLVFVNHKVIIKPTKLIEAADVISVRGLGKCRLTSIGLKTKKQRYHVTIHVYQ